jgi:uncharacterized protein YbjT (DUF2867 family)
MENNEKTILVTGATGNQGGAAARHLLEAGFKVRALVRDENKPTAVELKNRGAEIVKGDLFDKDSLVKAMTGVYGVFSVQNFWEHGYDNEILQGKNTADAAKEAEVKHFVYSSVASSDEKTGLAHFDSKWEVEQYIQNLALPFTIIRPVFFMENFESWFAPQEQEGKLSITMAMPKNAKLQMIAVDDVGAIAAVVFSNPDEYMGKTLELAGDEITIPEAAAAYSRVLNKDVAYNELPLDVLRANSKEMADMFGWFVNKGYSADIKETKAINPGLKNFETWVKGRVNVSK